MRLLLGRALLLLMVPALACSHAKSSDVPAVLFVEVMPDETLGVNDVVEVRVIGEPDLSGTFQIAADGTVQYPFVGRLGVAGLRPDELQELITRKLKDGLLVSPQVSVLVKEANSRKISVLGQVNKPGPVIYFPKMTIIDAITAAGGFTALAAQNSVKLRREVNGKTETATLRVGDIAEGRSPNVVVLPRDTLFVDERMF